MKSILVLIVLGLATVAAFWFVWINRASEKIVTSTVPIAVAALIGIFFAGWVFGGEDDYQIVFPVSFMIDLRTKLEIQTPYVFSEFRTRFGPSKVPELKRQRPDLFPDDKNYFARNVYHHYLQRSLVDFLVVLYRGSWIAQQVRFDIGTGGFGFYGPAQDAKSVPSRVLKKDEIEKALAGNWFAHINWLPEPELSLPPNSVLKITVPTGGVDQQSPSDLRIENDFCTVSFSVESDYPIRSVGEYRVMAGLSDEDVSDFATDTYVVRARIHYSKLRSGHPDMKRHKEWARQLVDEVRRQFDEELIWARVKEADMRARHYPPEIFTPHGRVPQGTR